MNRAFAASSLAHTSFVAPSSYYKLRGVQTFNVGRFSSGATIDRHQSLTESINSRVIGSRFLEVNRNSAAYGRLPLGSHVAVESSGELGPAAYKGDWLPPIPDPRLFGPNYGLAAYDEMSVNEHGVVSIPEEIDAEWVDLSADDTKFNYSPLDQAGSSRQPRVPKPDPPPLIRRETFPLRYDDYQDPETLPPPHLRLQPSQPFVRPLDGLGFDSLSHVYTDITQWRSRLKIINAEIAETQQDSYNDIASGTNITGWLLVGRGLRFIPGVELIEGRAKEDIRWDVLQNERSPLDSIVMWVVIIVVIIAMAASCKCLSTPVLSFSNDSLQ
jgi:calcium permeable stress-gated cation channel